MKFVKGMLVGGLVSAGIVMMYTEGMMSSKKTMVTKGKQFARKMGLI